MQSQRYIIRFLFAFLGSQFSVTAQLPTLSEGSYLGYHAIYRDRDIEFGISSDAEVRMQPGLSRGLSSSFMRGTYAIEAKPKILITRDNGTQTNAKIKPESLTTDGEATEEFIKSNIAGEAGDAIRFGWNIEQVKGSIVMGGQCTAGDSQSASPEFQIEIKIPAQLTKSKLSNLSKLVAAPADDRKAKRELRDFIRAYRDDRLAIRRVDGSTAKLLVAEPLTITMADLNGGGIAELELQSSIYEARRLIISADPGSSLSIETSRDKLLQPGFTITWKRDAEKDPEAKARVRIAVR
ncbi:MAG: hypothetical protein ACO3RV_02715 [Luteolibacter sp.]